MRNLNEKQHKALDRLADGQPDAIVVGWYDGERGAGPLIRAGKEWRVVNFTGYLRKVD